MSYDLNWLDEDLGIVAIRLFDPLHPDDLSGLTAELTPLFDSGRPLYASVDIRNFNALQALGMLGSSDGLPFPSIPASQAHNSRLAVVGGGSIVKLLLQMIDDADSSQLRPFEHEDEAYTWLLESAQAHHATSS